MKKNKPIKFPVTAETPTLFLHSIARDHGDDMEDVVIIARGKKDESMIFSTTKCHLFFSIVLKFLDVATTRLMLGKYEERDEEPEGA